MKVFSQLLVQAACTLRRTFHWRTSGFQDRSGHCNEDRNHRSQRRDAVSDVRFVLSCYTSMITNTQEIYIDAEYGSIQQSERM
jgi:hypothetical protein